MNPQEKRDGNSTWKVEAVRVLQQLMQYAQQGDFCGNVTMEVHSSHGCINKIVTRTEEHRHSA